MYSGLITELVVTYSSDISKLEEKESIYIPTNRVENAPINREGLYNYAT